MSNPTKYDNLTAKTEAFIEACQKGDLEKICKLLANGQSEDFDLNFGMEKADQHNQKNVIKYLLTSPDLDEYADIHNEDDGVFRSACMRGDLEFVKFLLTSPDLEEHADMHAMEDDGFQNALAMNHLEVVKYLLHSPDLKTRPDIHAMNDQGFICACENQSWDVLQYLIFDCDIKKTKHIREHLLEEPCVEVEAMFNKRELAKKLEQNLSQELSQSVSVANKKPKI